MLHDICILPFYQKILQHGEVWGGEVLCRVSTEGEITGPGELLDNVQAQGQEREFDLLFCEKVFRASPTPWLKNVSINVSPQALGCGGFASELIAVAQACHVDTRHFIIEITEHAQFQDTSTAIREITRLKQAGFRIAIDDFGCQHSNIDRVMMLCNQGIVDYIKINDIVHQNSFFACGVIESLQKMNLVTLIAECIEDEQQARDVERRGISLQQGYFFHKPSPYSAG